MCSKIRDDNVTLEHFLKCFGGPYFCSDVSNHCWAILGQTSAWALGWSCHFVGFQTPLLRVSKIPISLLHDTDVDNKKKLPILCLICWYSHVKARSINCSDRLFQNTINTCVWCRFVGRTAIFPTPVLERCERVPALCCHTQLCKVGLRHSDHVLFFSNVIQCKSCACILLSIYAVPKQRLRKYVTPHVKISPMSSSASLCQLRSLLMLSLGGV